MAVAASLAAPPPAHAAPAKSAAAAKTDGEAAPSPSGARMATLQEVVSAGNTHVRKDPRKAERYKPSKGQRKDVTDPKALGITNPDDVPASEREFKRKIEGMGIQEPMTVWRVDRLKNLTYSQMWKLVQAGHVDWAQPSGDHRSLTVRTKESAPGGARTQSVGIPYDEELFDHLLSHGVDVRLDDGNPWTPVVNAVARLLLPIAFSIWLVQIAFRLGRKKKRDKLFGGARMDMVKGLGISFADVAGIDEVKAEIMEVVQFLRNPERFLELGARSPAGILLVGPPGTGKTLLAKAIAGEAGVPFFSVAGTEFMEMFVGVGASRVRDMFEKARKNAPCILFIDEFDGIGKARDESGFGNDEGVTTINQLLTEMDGFEDNTGVVVLAATNRPAALDKALTRPGRFDRIINLPLPNVEGRQEILKVHARGKQIDPALDWKRMARATAGFTGAELMNLMNAAAIQAVRDARSVINEEIMLKALDKVMEERHSRRTASAAVQREFSEETLPPLLRRQVAVYEAAKALIAYITPDFDELAKVQVCPGGLVTGQTYLIPREIHLEVPVFTRAYLESKLVFHMAGRCGERLTLGDNNVSTAGVPDVKAANDLARQMVLRYGFNDRLGPMVFVNASERTYLKSEQYQPIMDMSAPLARAALQDVSELLEAAQAKAFYGLAMNWKALGALTDALCEKDTLVRTEIMEIMDRHNVKRFTADGLDGFGWDASGKVTYPSDSPAADAEQLAKAKAGEGDVVGAGKMSSPYKLSVSGSDLSDIDKLIKAAGM